MSKRSARCVLISYDEDEQAIRTCTVDRTSVTKLMQAALTIPWPLKDENFKLDDEFWRPCDGRRFCAISKAKEVMQQGIQAAYNLERTRHHPPTHKKTRPQPGFL